MITDTENGFYTVFLDIIAILALLFGIFTIVSKNPIVSIIFLIGLFICISGYLIFVGAEFLGISYILVYVGAVSILFLFILMLINIRISELVSDTNNYVPLAILTILILFTCLHSILPNIHKLGLDWKDIEGLISSSQEIVYVSSNDWDNSIINTTGIQSIGNIMYTIYPLWLLVTSIILLLAMVGSIVITIK